MPKKWTVMVYLAGDNNLGDECVFAIREMKRAKLDKNVNAIVELNTGVFDNTRFKIRHGVNLGEIRREVSAAQTREEKRIADEEKRAKRIHGHEPHRRRQSAADRIFEFVKYCIGTAQKPGPYRADHHMLVL